MPQRIIALMRAAPFTYAALLLLALQGCAFRSVVRTKQVVYQAATHLPAQRLNVFAPRHRQAGMPVFIFIHGGDWDKGHKELYSFFGARLARKGVVAVVADYPLSPAARYDGMAAAVARATAWAARHIQDYGGDTGRIFIGGHSAGGHLAALVATDQRFADSAAYPGALPIKGVVLIDAAGLDMAAYLRKGHLQDNPTYRATWSASPAEWERATPLTHLHAGMPPMLMLAGGRSYPAIIASNAVFHRALLPYQPDVVFSIQPRKHHVPMITQFLWSYNRRYKMMLDFMRARTAKSQGLPAHSQAER